MSVEWSKNYNMKLENSDLRIRAHHLLCLLNFRGGGYNRKFIENMERVVERLRSDPAPLAILTTEVDIICSACPYSKDKRCSKKADSEKKVINQDLKIIKKLGFRKGQKIPIALAWKRIKEKILAKDLPEICHSCQWLNRCSQIYPKTIKKLKF